MAARIEKKKRAKACQTCGALVPSTRETPIHASWCVPIRILVDLVAAQQKDLEDAKRAALEQARTLQVLSDELSELRREIGARKKGKKAK